MNEQCKLTPAQQQIVTSMEAGATLNYVPSWLREAGLTGYRLDGEKVDGGDVFALRRQGLIQTIPPDYASKPYPLGDIRFMELTPAGHKVAQEDTPS